MLHGEMGRVHVAEPNPAPEGQALHGSVGDGAAKAGVLQQLPGLEALPAFQRHALSHFTDGDEDALLHFAAGAHESQARPHSHGLGRIGARRLRPGVLHQQRILRRSPAILSLVDLQSLGVGDDQAYLRLAPQKGSGGQGGPGWRGVGGAC